MAWTIAVIVLLVLHAAWLRWEMKHAPTVNDDAGVEKEEHSDEHVEAEEKAASD